MVLKVIDSEVNVSENIFQKCILNWFVFVCNWRFCKFEQNEAKKIEGQGDDQSKNSAKGGGMYDGTSSSSAYSFLKTR